MKRLTVMKRITLLAMLLAFGLTLGAGAKEASPSNGGRNDTVLYEELIVGTPTALSGNFLGELWGSNTSDIDVRILLHAYSLVDWRSEESNFAVNQTVVSGLVSEMDSQGNKQFIISLADDLQYSDGSPITVKDYVFTLLLSASPEMTALGGMTSQTKYVLGAPEYTAGETNLLQGVRLLTDKTFSITIDGEYLPFFYELGLLSFNPYPIQEIAPGCEVADDGQGAYIRNILPEGEPREEDEEPLFTVELLQKTLFDTKTGYVTYPKVTSGSYMLIAYDPDTHTARFAINPYYIGDHEGRQPVIERLVFQPVQTDTMMRQLADGEVDLLNKCVQASAIRKGMELRANEPFSMKQYMRSGLGFISFNCEQGPAQFVNVRQALAMCLDRDAFIEQQLENFGMKVNGYYGLGQWMTRLVTGTLPAPLPELSESPTAAEQAAYNEAEAGWAALSLEGLNDYAVDLDAARKLLEEDGWTLNQEGKDFDARKDPVRAKLVEDELMLLEMHLLVPQESVDLLLFEDMQENAREIGAILTMETMAYEDMLRLYYRQEPRENDMFFLGTNFTTMFDPTHIYSIFDEDQGALNTTGLRDEQLMNLAIDLYKTEPGDVLGYCQKWIAFQEYWNEVLPMIPIYSNQYFDFHTDRLHDYWIDQHITWGEAVLYSYLSQPLDRVVNEAGEDAGAEGDMPLQQDAPVGGIPVGGVPLE